MKIDVENLKAWIAQNVFLFGTEYDMTMLMADLEDPEVLQDIQNCSQKEGE